ncbi:MAG: T9SS type A sorting domain-containing protein [Saprospiraceae bacterium]|nr:T9SS type A sorting domain-containing protein [Saprospiraceae bacterium]
MKKLFLLSIFTFVCLYVEAQKHDFKWLLGYSFADNPLDTGFGSSIMDFNTADGNPIFYEEKYKKIDFSTNSANICDSDGNYLFAFNGAFVEGPTDKLMQNADALSNDGTKYPELGTAQSQGSFIIPYPEKSNQYLLFFVDYDYIQNYGLANTGLWYSSIDMTKNNGEGKMTGRRISILKDTLDDGCLIGVKHANGRDWWIIVSEDTRVGYYIYIASPAGVKFHKYFLFPGIRNRGESGQAFFSNNGEYFVSALDDHLVRRRYSINFFQFDRCEGNLFNYQLIKLGEQDDWSAGCSFSSDNRFLYVAGVDNLYQFSIKDNKLTDQKLIAQYDGYKELHPVNWHILTKFGLMQQAPDGRIYNSSTNYTFNALHIINNPNEEGVLCNYVQHGISSTSPKSCIPNFPNYRLGPIDGSGCDSLGIDNIPWCHWRYNQDTVNYLNFVFTDLSAYEVEIWCWDFGDPASGSNNTSMEKNPLHRFSANGIYSVCLIVKNKNGADTLCRTIKIGNVVSTENQKIGIEINTLPNPCKDFLVVNVLDYNPEKMVLHLYNQLGQSILTQKLYQGSNIIDTRPLSFGSYFLSIEENNLLLKKEILIKR